LADTLSSNAGKESKQERDLKRRETRIRAKRRKKGYIEKMSQRSEKKNSLMVYRIFLLRSSRDINSFYRTVPVNEVANSGDFYEIR
jgi:hypothetical protein